MFLFLSTLSLRHMSPVPPRVRHLSGIPAVPEGSRPRKDVNDRLFSLSLSLSRSYEWVHCTSNSLNSFIHFHPSKMFTSSWLIPSNTFARFEQSSFVHFVPLSTSITSHMWINIFFSIKTCAMKPYRQQKKKNLLYRMKNSFQRWQSSIQGPKCYQLDNLDEGLLETRISPWNSNCASWTEEPLQLSNSRLKQWIVQKRFTLAEFSISSWTLQGKTERERNKGWIIFSSVPYIQPSNEGQRWLSPF